MKKTILLVTLIISSLAFGQQNPQKKSDNNYFKIGAQLGLGIGFKNIEAFIDENGKKSTISGGGGYNVQVEGRYIMNRRYELGTSFGYHFSLLRPQLSNVDATFTRISILPTFKYLIPINSQKDLFLNIGAGYGFYINGKMNINGTTLGLQEIDLEYNNASGIILLTEYEYNPYHKFGITIGLRYYGGNYDIKELTGESDFDKLNGSGIDLYVGVSYVL